MIIVNNKLKEYVSGMVQSVSIESRAQGRYILIGLHITINFIAMGEDMDCSLAYDNM